MPVQSNVAKSAGASSAPFPLLSPPPHRVPPAQRSKQVHARLAPWRAEGPLENVGQPSYFASHLKSGCDGARKSSQGRVLLRALL